MEDCIELGIEAVDKCVDKHFHKLPDKALHSRTYHPRNIKNSISRRLRDNGPTENESGSESIGAEEGGSDDGTLDQEKYSGQNRRARQSLDEGRRRKLEPVQGRDRFYEENPDLPRYPKATYGKARPPSYTKFPPSSINYKGGHTDLESNLPLPDRQSLPQQNLRRRRSLPYDEPRSRDMINQQGHQKTKGSTVNTRRNTVDE